MNEWKQFLYSLLSSLLFLQQNPEMKLILCAPTPLFFLLLYFLLYTLLLLLLLLCLLLLNRILPLLGGEERMRHFYLFILAWMFFLWSSTHLVCLHKYAKLLCHTFFYTHTHCMSHFISCRCLSKCFDTSHVFQHTLLHTANTNNPTVVPACFDFCRFPIKAFNSKLFQLFSILLAAASAAIYMSVFLFSRDIFHQGGHAFGHGYLQAPLPHYFILASSTQRSVILPDFSRGLEWTILPY